MSGTAFKARLHKVHDIIVQWILLHKTASQRKKLKGLTRVADKRAAAVAADIYLMVSSLRMSMIYSSEEDEIISLRWLFGLYVSLDITDIGAVADGIREVDESVYVMYPQLREIFPLLEQDGFIRKIETTDTAYQYRPTPKGQTLLEILKGIMPCSFHDSPEEIAAKMTAAVTFQCFQRLVASMSECALRSKLQEQCDALELFLNDGVQDT